MVRIEPGERFREAAEEWGDARMMDFEDAFEAKAEQALLEIEHLTSGAHEVDFDVEDGTIRYEPSDELAAFLADQAAESGVDEETILRMYVNLFASVFLDEDTSRPTNAPPK